MPQNNLPFHIIDDIFSKLPVKTLKRFKSILKSCHSLIEDQRFINSHLIQSLETSRNLRLVLIYTIGAIFTRPEETPIYVAELNSVNSFSFKKINSMLRGIYKVLGSCNGLLCLMNWKQNIILWNMATREYHHIVTSTLYGPLTSSSPRGFGYNSIDDDYKFMMAKVELVSDENFFVSYATSVYSLRSGAWRYHTFYNRYEICGSRKAVFVDGSLNWVGFRGLTHKAPSHLIAAFDLGTEKFHEVCLPDELSSPGGVDVLELSVLRGLLCVTHYCGNKCSDSWIMKDYKVKGSWSKLFSIVVEEGLWCPRPLAYSRYGDKILMGDEMNTLFWYDPVKEQVEKVDNIPDCMRIFSAEIFHESLVEMRVYRWIHGRKRQCPQEAQKYSRLKIKG